MPNESVEISWSFSTPTLTLTLDENAYQFTTDADPTYTKITGNWATLFPTFTDITVSYQWVSTDNPSDVTPPADEIIAKGTAYITQEQTPTGEGYSFDGWYTDENCTIKFVDGTILYEDTILYGKWTTISETGNLTISKTVSGSGADKERVFTFTVTLNDTTISGQYGDLTFENGVATFTLKHSESKTAASLPAGVTYTVAESDNEGYTVTSTDTAGTIESDVTVRADFNNERSIQQIETGNLTVSKTVSGSDADKERAFTFTVTLSDTTISGQYGDLTFDNGIATFTLKHSESKTAASLPAGVTYTVAESDNDGYTVTSNGTAGTIESDATVSTDFNNERSNQQNETGNLTVSKTVSGSGADKERAFTFTVTLSDTTISGQYGDLIFENGVATFTLKHGESKTTSSLPAGVTYAVAESDNDGYKVTSTSTTGTIESGATVSADFNNERSNQQIGVAQTSDNSSIMPWFISLLLSGTGVFGITFYSKRKAK